MTALLLAALLRLMAAVQMYDDGSGLLPLMEDDYTQTRVVWCVGPCNTLENPDGTRDYVGNGVSWSKIPLAPVNQDDYSPYEALDIGEYNHE